jgi:hypothetical protein
MSSFSRTGRRLISAHGEDLCGVRRSQSPAQATIFLWYGVRNTLPTYEARAGRLGGLATGTLRYMRRNPERIVALCMLLSLKAVTVLGTPQKLEFRPT